MSEEELEDKLEKGDFSVFTQRASTEMLLGVTLCLLIVLFQRIALSTPLC